MNKPKINLIITDLDDTIWDWLKMWYASFSPFLNRISEEFDINIEDLKNDFAHLHKKYGTTEVSYAYNELKTLNDVQKASIAEEKEGKRSIIHQYYSDKKNNLILYPEVLSTFKELKKIGVKIVGFTESKSFYTMYRIKHLQLDGYFSIIYTPKDHDLPLKVKRFYEEDYWHPQKTEIKELSESFKKPNPQILLDIINEVGGKIENTIYIGDKLDRDIYMAKLAKVISVYAKYGHIINNAQYELLRDVTHWTKKDVLREKEFKKSFKDKIVEPDYILEKTYSKILNLFNFQKFE